MFRGTEKNKKAGNAQEMEKCPPLPFFFFLREGWLIACAMQLKFSTLFMLVADVVMELILYTGDFILHSGNHAFLSL